MPKRICAVFLLSGASLAAEPWTSSPASLGPERISARAPATADARIAEIYGRLAPGFERNRGQFDDRVAFLLRGRSYTVALATTSFTVGGPGGGPAIRIVLEGARSGASLMPIGTRAGKVHYFRGHAAPVTSIDVYDRVRLTGAYGGIDIDYYTDEGRLEFDLVVAPEAAPERVAFRFESEPGDDGARLTLESGDLVIRTAAGVLRQKKPRVYQETASARVEIPSRYVMLEGRRAGIELGAYDRTRALVIDPVVEYSTFAGGSGNESAHAIAVDAAGSAYITGFTSSPGLPASASGAISGLYDAFVMKLDPTGSAVVYTAYIGGSGWEHGDSIAVDALGHAYITGRTDSVDFPTTAGALDRTCGADGVCDPDALGPHTDAFVSRLSADGSTLVYSTYLGGSSYENGNPSNFLAGRDGRITVDALGNAYVTGYTQSVDFPVVGALQRSLATDGSAAGPGLALAPDAFLTRLRPDGSVVFSTYLGGVGADNPVGVALDGTGHIYIAGNTSGSFPVTPNAFTTTGSGIFVAKLDPLASRLVYSTLINNGGANALAVTAAGDAFIAGGTTNFGFPTTPGAYQRTKAGDIDVIAARLSLDGSRLVYATYLGAWDDEVGYALAVDRSGNAYIAGATTSPIGYPPAGGRPCDATPNVFVAVLDPTGSAPRALSCFGGGLPDVALGIAIDAAGASYVSGRTSSSGAYYTPSFPTTGGAAQPFFGGGADDAFVTRLLNPPSPYVIPTPSSLSFGAQTVGTASAPQTARLRNTGTAPLEIASITASLDYAVTTTCGGSLAVNAECTMTVTFTPSATVTREGWITVTDNADGSPHRVNMIGWGTGGPAVNLSPGMLAFGDQAVGSTSAAKVVTLTNTGTTPLTITGIGVGAGFAQTNNCGSSVAPLASCAISVTFTPPAAGSTVGYLSVSDNAPGSPHFVTLTGTGVVSSGLPVVQLSASQLKFGRIDVGTASGEKGVTLRNIGSAPLLIGAIVAEGDFSVRHGCGASLAPGGSCRIRVRFRPTAIGVRSGAVIISTNATGSPHTVTLSGRGV